MKKLSNLILIPVCAVALIGCNKIDTENEGTAQLKIQLTDAPASYDKVNIDIVGLEVIINDSIIDMDVEAGIYNLLDLVNGKDTVIADKQIPSGKLSQIRIILGDNNSLIIGQSSFDLKTPSAQQSGLKLNVHDDFIPGIAYEYTIDFDAAKSIVETGNGKYILKPVLRVNTSAVSGAIKGIVFPPKAKPWIYAISEQQDSISTSADTTSGNFMFTGLPSGTYKLSFLPQEPYSDTTLHNISVINGALTKLDTLKFK
jgi:hypothetical protein